MDFRTERNPQEIADCSLRIIPEFRSPLFTGFDSSRPLWSIFETCTVGLHQSRHYSRHSGQVDRATCLVCDGLLCDGLQQPPKRIRL